MKEIWKDIKDYEGLYQVSNLGNVKSMGRYKKTCGNSLYWLKERIMKPLKSTSGYLQVGLFDRNGKCKKMFIHRLVALTFLSNTYNLPEVNHKDECKTNNRLDNLEWCDSKYNNNYGTHNDRGAIARSKPIKQFSKYGIFIKDWINAREIERELGYKHGYIAECCKGRYKQAYGYIWRYK